MATSMRFNHLSDEERTKLIQTSPHSGDQGYIMAPLHFSTSLRQLLHNLRDDYDDPVARVLLRQRYHNFRHSDGYGVEFGYLYGTHRNFGDYLTYTADGMLSFLPASKIEEALSDNQQWKKKARQTGRPGKVVRSVLLPSASKALSDMQIETFVNRLKAAVSQTQIAYTVVQGEDIRYWYHADRHASERTGTLAHSCMRYDQCQPYFDLYVNNPNQIRMLVMTNPQGGMVGRALLWKTDQVGWVMDRVYGNDVTRILAREWAREQGYWHRNSDMAGDADDWVDADGTFVGNKTLSVTPSVPLASRYPYLDTFSYLYAPGKRAKAKLRNKPQGRTAVFQLTHTTGRPYDIYSCRTCHVWTTPGYISPRNRQLCSTCWQAIACTGCYNVERSTHPDRTGTQLCDTCYEARVCVDCNYFSLYGSLHTDPATNEHICSQCYDARLTARTCGICARTGDPKDTFQWFDPVWVCAACRRQHQCGRCQTYVPETAGTLHTVNVLHRPYADEVFCTLTREDGRMDVRLCDTCYTFHVCSFCDRGNARQVITDTPHPLVAAQYPGSRVCNTCLGNGVSAYAVRVRTAEHVARREAEQRGADAQPQTVLSVTLPAYPANQEVVADTVVHWGVASPWFVALDSDDD